MRINLPADHSKSELISQENPENATGSEIQDYLEDRHQRRRILPRSALVGAAAGTVALLFRIVLTLSDTMRGNLLDWAHRFPKFGWIFPVAFTLLGAGISVALTRRFAPEASGSGIPHLEAVLHRFRNMDWKRVLPVKFFGGIIAIGSGMALGREGPTVQMGGAVGDALSRLFKSSQRERLTLISAGAGAGLAAAFNAPLSGLIFVLEEVRRDFQPIVFGAAFIAAIVADIIARLGAGQFPVFIIPNYPVPPLGALPFFAIMGIAAGFLGVLFNKWLVGTKKLTSSIPSKYAILVAGFTGGIIGLAGWFSPFLMGSGFPLAESALEGNLVLSLIPLFFILRFVMTNASYGTGAPGGIFAPMLVLGALIGSGIGQIAHLVAPTSVPIPAVFAVVGMAAYFTAVVRAPLTGIMLIVEMTGNYALMLPLLTSCFCAYAIAELLKDMPVYEALLQLDLNQNGSASLLKEPAVVDYIVQPGASFAGMQVRSLGLPPGCILVRCSDGRREWVPKANTRLEPHMRLTAMIAPEASDSLEILRRGCASPEP